MAEKTTEQAQKPQQQHSTERQLTRRPSGSMGNPWGIFDQFTSEMDRLFDDFGFGRSWLAPSSGRRSMGSPQSSQQIWRPAVEVSQRDHDLVVRADLPGLKKDDINVDVTENAITISGERRSEEEHNEGGVYRTERHYGSFSRTIPLPEGAMTDQARATFENGVLEITIPSPPEQVRRGRRIDIGEGAPSKQK